MFRKTMTSVAARRFATAITALALSLSGLVFSPAQASVPVDGSYKCGTGQIDGGSGTGYYTIATGAVSSGGSCTGAVLIPEGVTSIGDVAFRNSTSTSVIIPASVRSIGNRAFMNSPQLTSITFAPGSQLESIGIEAFREVAVTSIGIPASVTSIGAGAFSKSLTLASIAVDPSNVSFTVIDGALFNIDGTRLIAYPLARSAPSFRIPDGIQGIELATFAFSANLRSVIIPASVTSIGIDAFAYTSIDLLFLGNAPTVADASTFFSAKQTVYIKSGATGFDLTPNFGGLLRWGQRISVVETGFYESVSFDSKGGSSIATRGYGKNIPAPTAPTKAGYTFAGWTATDGGETTVTFPYAPSEASSITLYAKWNAIPVYNNVNGSYKCGTGQIDGGSGDGYYQIVNDVVIAGGLYGGGNCTGAVVIPDGVTSIGQDAFLFSGELTSVNIPDSVTSIGRSAFHANFKLTSITIPANVTSIGREAFWNIDKLATVTFAPGSKLTSIGDFAFVYAKGLKSIKIPASVTSIGKNAFEGALILTDVAFEGNAPALVGIDAFKALPSSARAYIKSGATGFTTSGDPALWNNLAVAFIYEGVSFNSNGGTAVATQDFLGSITAPTAPTRAGYTFGGWTATDGGETIVSFPYTPSETSNITLYAKWTQNLTKAVASTKPSLTGKAIATAKGTNKLTAAKGTWTGIPTPVITYQWYSCSAQVKATTSTIPKTCKAISKATKSTFAVTNSYKAKYLAVAVIGKGTGTTATTWLSKSTVKVK